MRCRCRKGGGETGPRGGANTLTGTCTVNSVLRGVGQEGTWQRNLSGKLWKHPPRTCVASGFEAVGRGNVGPEGKRFRQSLPSGASSFWVRLREKPSGVFLLTVLDRWTDGRGRLPPLPLASARSRLCSNPRGQGRRRHTHSRSRCADSPRRERKRPCVWAGRRVGPRGAPGRQRTRPALCPATPAAPCAAGLGPRAEQTRRAQAPPRTGSTHDGSKTARRPFERGRLWANDWGSITGSGVLA